jgi:RimJ/RimL family protein N-acetyltransferase
MNLGELDSLKFPLRYGTDRCCIVLSDSRYAEQIVALRNDPALNAWIHKTDLNVELQNVFLSREIAQRDRFNFVILVDHEFCGTAGIYNIEHGISGEYGRLIMPDDPRRIYALAVEFLIMSFGFEILGLPQMHCNVVAENKSVIRLHLTNGWRQDMRYSYKGILNGEEVSHVGFSMSLDAWPRAAEKMHSLLRRLLV